MGLSSLRVRLLLLVLVAVLPGIGLLVSAGWEGDRRLQEGLRDEARRTADLLSEEQVRAIESAQGLLTGISRLAALVAPIDPVRCSAALADIRTENPAFNNLSVLDAAGDIVCAATPLPRRINVSHRAHFQRAVERRAFSAGQYLLAQINDRPTFYFAAPVFGPFGRVEAVVTAGLDLASMQRRLEAQALPPGAVAVVTDEDGVVLAERPGPPRVGERYRGPLLAQLRGGGSGLVVEQRDDDGLDRVHAFHPVGGPGGRTAMLVAVGLPIGPARAEVRAVFGRTLLAFGGVALLAVAVALAMAERLLVSPLGRIIGAARRLSAGDLRARTGLRHGAGEVDQLASAFDEMASSLEALSRQNRLILDSAGEGILGLDRAGRITFANPAATRALGREQAELHGRPLRDFAEPEPGHEPAAGHGLAPAPSEEAAHQVSAVLVRRDGRRFPVEYVTTPISDHGAVVGAVVTFRDVSDRRRLEEQLRHAQKMEAVGQLAGGVAHDFNNLLTAILSFGRFVKADLGEAHPSRADVDEILASAERAATLTRQLLAFSRRQVLEPRVLDLGQTVRGVEKMLRRLIGEHIALETRIAPSLGRVRADPGHVEQVVLNLAVNARDAMPDGGRLLIEVADVPAADPEALADVALPRGPLVRLSLSDTGTGMDAATLDRIFEPFFTTKPAGKGTGLGLSTVYGIVTQSGGAVRVRSAPGRGSTFHVYLPRVEAQAGEEAVTPSAALPLAGTEAVLLVEDDGAVRALARRVLAQAGYRVLEAARPSEALERARGEAGVIHLLLTDVILPETNGPDLAARLARERPGLRVLFTSGYTGGFLAAEDVAASGHAFLPKPFTPEALRRRVREVLDAPPPGAAPRQDPFARPG